MVTQAQIDSFIAAKAAIATEQAAVVAGWPSDEEPAISDLARSLLVKGGIDAVIDSGECPDCAAALIARRLSIAAHNRRVAALAAAKAAAGYDAAFEPLGRRLEQLAPRKIVREDLSSDEATELATIREALGA